jgi:hypothetical protein
MPRGRNWVTGEQLAQVDNRDPFAPPVWRSPVYRTPEPVIMVVQLARLIWRVLWFALTHPGADAVAALVVVIWLGLGWPGVVGLAVIGVVGLAGLRILQPVWFARLVGAPVRDWLRWWFYRPPVEGRHDTGRSRPGLPRPAYAPGCSTGCTGPGRFTMKQYVQTDLEADRQVANTLAELITGGALASMEVSTSEGAA